MKLHLVFIWGFLASLGVIAGLAWLFAAYETANWWPWSAEPKLSQDKLFEIVRNAVTSAAALGVGVTLFFSYRRQQTAEETQRIGAEAQRTAAKAQETAAEALQLSTKQHALDQERRKDAVTAELRTRYAQTAEQLASSHLPVRLAGIYSLAALADDWAGNGNEVERQVCIDLLGAYFRSSQTGQDAGVRQELVAATFDVVLSRLRPEGPELRSWSQSKIVLSDPGNLPSLAGGLLVKSGGSFTIRGARLRTPYIQKVEINGGQLAIDDLILTNRGRFFLEDTTLLSGRLSVATRPERNEHSERPEFFVRNLTLDGATLSLNVPGTSIFFTNCTFKAGSFLLITEGVYFKHCRFEGNVFEEFDVVEPGMTVMAKGMRVEDCTFENDAPVLRTTGDLDEVPKLPF